MTTQKNKAPTSLLESKNPVDAVKWLVSLIVKREWPGLAFAAGIILLILLRPKGGLIVKDILPDDELFIYGRIFWLCQMLLWGTGFLLLLFKELRSMRKKKKEEGEGPKKGVSYFKFFIVAVLSLFALGLARQNLKTSVRPSNYLQCDVSGDCFSWGENILMSYGYIQDSESLESNTYEEGNEEKNINKSENPLEKCKQSWRLKASATAVYNTEGALERLNTFKGQCPNDAEAVIYRNNLQALESGRTFDIAVSLPISIEGGESESQEILRGIAIAQHEINKDGVNGRKILVGIADDGFISDDPEQDALIVREEREAAENVASNLVDYPQVIGVVGHFSSDATEAAATKYGDELLAISPTSTAIRQSQDYSTLGIPPDTGIHLDSSTLRTALNDGEVISALLSRINSPEYNYDKIAVVYESNSKYSNFFKETFSDAFEADGGMLMPDPETCDFNRNTNYNELTCLEHAKETGVQALILAPSTKSSKSVRDLIIKNAESFNFPLIGADSMYDASFLDEKTEGMFIYVTWHRSDSDTNISDFEQSAFDIFRTPEINWRTATAYDAAKTLAKGIEIASKNLCEKKKWVSRFSFNENFYTKCIRANLKSAIYSENFKADGALGSESIRYDANGDRKNINGLGVFVKVTKHGEGYDFIRG